MRYGYLSQVAAAAGRVMIGYGLLLLANACTDPDIAGNTWICADDHDCASSFRCQAGICVPRAGDDATHDVQDAARRRDVRVADSRITFDVREDVAQSGDEADVGDSTEPKCDCDDADAPCCDGCHFVLQGERGCGEAVETRCGGEVACGGAVEERRAVRYCSGESAACDGELATWSGWTTVATCTAVQRCDGENAACVAAPACQCEATCDDGDACTTDECTGQGQCRHGMLTCDDDDACTADLCDVGSGCKHTPRDCDDDDPCTTDSCDPAGGCAHDAVVDGESCTAGDGAGRCVSGECCVPRCDGRDCGDDGCGGLCGTCDGSGVCDGGACVSVPGCGDDVCAPTEGENCRTCSADCVDEGATPEVCDGIDNDCDGATDDDLPAERPCQRSAPDVGTCDGVETCRGVSGWVCDASAPNVETCNGLDDDCDGATDEDLDDPLVAGCRTAGVCATDVRASCELGDWVCDYGAIAGYESVEASCDGVDNDCDGQTDEGLADVLAADCPTAGACAAGVAARCDAGGWTCDFTDVSDWEADEATCDGIDNDCDGATDEELRVPMGPDCPDAGVCGDGGAASVCEGGAWRCDTSSVTTYEPDETLCDGLDNDCDGATDEALSESTSATNCRTVGVCADGVPASCAPGGTWSCRYEEVDGYEPDETSCDSRDNDCDGETDENVCSYAGEPCTTDADCAAGPCRLDIDGGGRFCAATDRHCVLAGQADVAEQKPDGHVHCLGGSLSHRRCDAGRWSAAGVCDDGDPCTTDACESGPGCTTSPAPDATPCDDGDRCTRTDRCVSGICAGTPDPCDDGVSCTVDTCEPAAGCVHNTSDAACDDEIACTTDRCDVTVGCEHTPVDASCDDGVACTAEHCNPVLGCRAVPQDAACDDHVPCTADRCVPEVGCVSTPDDTLCDDLVACTNDTCDPIAGCQHAWDDSPCDDGVPCTVDACVADGSCTNEPDDTLCDDGVACTADVCVPVEGCVHTPDDGVCQTPGGCGYATCDPSGGCTEDVARCDCVALKFFGHERVSIEDEPELSGGSGVSRTFELWVRPDTFVDEDWGAPLLTKVDDESNGDWAITAEGPDLAFRWFRTGASMPDYIVAPNVFTEGEWTHVAVAFDRPGGTVRVLADGVVVASAGVADDMADTMASVYVGPTPHLWPGSFYGSIDEVRIWIEPRETAEIVQDFDRPLAGTESGLRYYWTFEDRIDRSLLETVGPTGKGLKFASGATIPSATLSRLVGSECEILERNPFVFTFYAQMSVPGTDTSFLEIENIGDRVLSLDGYVLKLAEIPESPGGIQLASESLRPGQSWYIGINNGPADGPIFPAAETALSLQLSYEMPFDMNNVVLLLSPEGDVEDSIGSFGGQNVLPDVDGGPWRYVYRRMDIVVGDIDPLDVFVMQENWIAGESALDVSLPPVCSGARCPWPDSAIRSVSLRDKCAEISAGVDAYGWGALDVYGMMAWVPPDECSPVSVRFVDGYWVDVYEVVSAAVVDFVNERASNLCPFDGVSYPCVDTSSAQRTLDWEGAQAVARDTCGSSSDGSCSRYPAAGVTWSGARTFCEWIGARLCTHSEWLRAAGGRQGRRYPWGDTFETISEVGGPYVNCAEYRCQDGWSGPGPTLEFRAGVSPVGAFHMAGNVWEWVEDDWHFSTADNPRDGSAWVSTPRSAMRTICGGGYDSTSASELETTSREPEPIVPTSDRPIGFRCCRDPD